MPEACPVCLGQIFDEIASLDVGTWRHAAGPELARQRIRLPIGGCRRCGHTMITSHYSRDFLHFLYNSDPVIGDDRWSYADTRVIDFCRPELDTADGLFLDLGCGTGILLGLLRDTGGISEDRLAGVDFIDKGIEDGQFLAADLNALDVGSLDLPAGDIGFVFCTQVLEHVVDPRAFVSAVRNALGPASHFYIDVPNFACARLADALHGGLVTPHHIHYFTPTALSRLLGSCGFDLVRIEDGPVLRVLATPHHATTAADTVSRTLGKQRAQRARIADELLSLAGRGHRVGLWGLGAEFDRLVRENPALAAALPGPAFILFDLVLAGHRLQGKEIQHPCGLARFDGVIVRLPLLHKTITRMDEYAATVGLPAARIVDPWKL